MVPLRWVPSLDIRFEAYLIIETSIPTFSNSKKEQIGMFDEDLKLDIRIPYTMLLPYTTSALHRRKERGGDIPHWFNCQKGTQ